MPNRAIPLNWASGKPSPLRPATATEFEKQMRKLELTNETCARSEDLRRWCRENRDRCYVPEWLLKAWGMKVGFDG